MGRLKRREAVCFWLSWRIFWLSTAASYQVKLKSGLEAKRPRTRKASARLASS